MPHEPRGTATTAPPRRPGGVDDWSGQLVRALALDGQPRLEYQPIIDLARGVVTGYEALARFDVEPYEPPDRWFDAASRHGHSAALEARVVDQAIDQLADLPINTFLTVNLDPDQAGDRAVRDAFEATERLDRLFVEVTERKAIEADGDLPSQLSALRERGAMIALDDVGAGYAGLQAILRLRPHLVKLDRSLITHIDVDAARRAVVSRIGRLADDLDAWVLAEGVERLQELETLLSLGVPLGQGWLLGRPSGGFATDVPTDVVRAVSTHRRATPDDHSVAQLVITPVTTTSGMTRDLALSLIDSAATVVRRRGRRARASGLGADAPTRDRRPGPRGRPDGRQGHRSRRWRREACDGPSTRPPLVAGPGHRRPRAARGRGPGRAPRHGVERRRLMTAARSSRTGSATGTDRLGRHALVRGVAEHPR